MRPSTYSMKINYPTHFDVTTVQQQLQQQQQSDQLSKTEQDNYIAPDLTGEYLSSPVLFSPDPTPSPTNSWSSNLTMYDTNADMKLPYTVPSTANDRFIRNDSFDFKQPQFEQSENLLNMSTTIDSLVSEEEREKFGSESHLSPCCGGSLCRSPYDDLRLEDAFQVDKVDVMHGPTLAQLNAGLPETVFLEDIESIISREESGMVAEETQPSLSSSCPNKSMSQPRHYQSLGELLRSPIKSGLQLNEQLVSQSNPAISQRTASIAVGLPAGNLSTQRAASLSTATALSTGIASSPVLSSARGKAPVAVSPSARLSNVVSTSARMPAAISATARFPGSYSPRLPVTSSTPRFPVPVASAARSSIASPLTEFPEAGVSRQTRMPLGIIIPARETTDVFPTGTNLTPSGGNCILFLPDGSQKDVVKSEDFIRSSCPPFAEPKALDYSPLESLIRSPLPANRLQLLTCRADDLAAKSATDAVEGFLKLNLSPASGTAEATFGDAADSLEQKWEDIKNFIDDDIKARLGSPAAKRIKMEEMSEGDDDYDDSDSEDEGFEDSENDNYHDDFSDNESVASMSSNFVHEKGTPGAIATGGNAKGGSKKEKRYFWQYNTQSKGPKGKRLCKTVAVKDPHVLNDFEDPVFDPELNQHQYKHNGKARKGDGNDVVPHPYKLYQIGNELRRLNKIIGDMTPTNELPVGVRTKSRREKNKFASRACRLKKKAQHEANKVKLYGLKQEHCQLMTVIEAIKVEIRNKLETLESSAASDDSESLTDKLDRLMKTHLTVMIAGYTSEYVSLVMEKVASGDTMGGLQISNGRGHRRKQPGAQYQNTELN